MEQRLVVLIILYDILQMNMALIDSISLFLKSRIIGCGKILDFQKCSVFLYSPVFQFYGYNFVLHFSAIQFCCVAIVLDIVIALPALKILHVVGAATLSILWMAYVSKEIFLAHIVVLLYYFCSFFFPSCYHLFVIKKKYRLRKFLKIFCFKILYKLEFLLYICLNHTLKNCNSCYIL